MSTNPSDDDGFPQPTGSSHDDLRAIREWFRRWDHPVTAEMLEAGVIAFNIAVDDRQRLSKCLKVTYRAMRALEPTGVE